MQLMVEPLVVAEGVPLLICVCDRGQAHIAHSDCRTIGTSVLTFAVILLGHLIGFLPVNANVDATNAEAVVELLTYCQLEIGIDVKFGVDGHTSGERCAFRDFKHWSVLPIRDNLIKECLKYRPFGMLLVSIEKLDVLCLQCFPFFFFHSL